MENKIVTLAEAVERAGSQAALAREIGCTQQAISERIKGGKPTPSEWVVAIERATGIPRQQLRPDLYAGMLPAPRRGTHADMDAARYEEALTSAAPECAP